MNPQDKLGFDVRLCILKPAAEVFESIIDPAKMANYFIQSGSARMIEGTTVTWKFDEHIGFPVHIKSVVENKLVRFEWGNQEGGLNPVEIRLNSLKNGSTVVSVSESGWSGSEVGKKWSYLNCSGWMNFLTCQKAWLEYGIHLRKGAFPPELMAELI